MKLIVGLGNPEEKYDNTRHNVGFWFVKKYAETQNLTFQHKSKFKSLIAEYTADKEKIILARPTTYYNLSGEAVQAIASYYKVEPSDTLVVHDELALPFNTIRTRTGGEHAGNNGIKSITEHIGPDYHRIRIGIANDLRTRLSDSDFVLGTFGFEESTLLKDSAQEVYTFINEFIADGTLRTTTKRLAQQDSTDTI